MPAMGPGSARRTVSPPPCRPCRIPARLPVGADLAHPLQHLDRDALALLQAREETPHRVRRPAGRLRDLRHRRALGPAEHGEDLLLLGALAGPARRGGIARGTGRLAGQGGAEPRHRALEGADHVGVPMGRVLPGGEHRRGGIAQAAPRRGAWRREGLVEQGKVLRAGGVVRRRRRGLGGFGGAGGVGLRWRLRRARGRRVRGRCGALRVDADGAQPLVRDLQQDAVAIHHPEGLRIVGGPVHRDHQVVLQQRLRHRLPRCGRQALGRQCQVLGVLRGGGQDRALRVGELHPRGLRPGTRPAGCYHPEPRRQDRSGRWRRRVAACGARQSRAASAAMPSLITKPVR